MNKNVGEIDKLLRMVVGLIIMALGIINGSLLGLIGLIPLLTGVISWCPLYLALKISTCSIEEYKVK